MPFEVANDGEVAALAGSMSLGDNAVLGISMGTSQAGGYVRPGGDITPWLNELSFAPVDYRTEAPTDEWSGDAGCGVQYFSQQAVSRLADLAGFRLPADMPAPERLVAVQEAMASGDPRAEQLYDTIGSYLGYSIGHYADFYHLRHVLVMGRVTSGTGGSESSCGRGRSSPPSFPPSPRGPASGCPTRRTSATARQSRRRAYPRSGKLRARTRRVQIPDSR